MIFNRKKLFVSSSILIMIPSFFVVSCSSQSSDELLEQTTQLNDFLSNNANSLKPKTDNSNTTIGIKNFVNISSWKNFDDFLNQINKYIDISDELQTKLKENNNSIYNKIKRVVIQPIEGKTSLTVIFYLGNSNTDKNLVSKVVENALESNFSYENKLDIVIPESQSFISKDKFNDLWKNAIDKKDNSSLNELLKEAFGNNDETINKISSNRDNFRFEKNSNYQITITILQSGISNGFIFNISGSTSINGFNNVVTSNSLVNE